MNEQLLNTLKDLDESLKQHAQASANERAAVFEQFVLTRVDLSNSMNKSQRDDKENLRRSANALE